MSYVFVFRRRLQDVSIKTYIFPLVIRLQKTASRRVQNVLIKANIFVFVIRLQDVLPTRLEDVIKTSCKNVFKTFLRLLQDVLERCLQDILKTYHQVKLLLLTRLQDIFETYSASFWDVLTRRWSTERFEIFWSVYKIFQNELFGKSFKTKHLMC